MDEQGSILVLLARMEGKLDVVVASVESTKEALGSTNRTVADHEARLRVVEEPYRRVEDHETRLRVVEGRPYITPWKLWTSLLGAVTAVVGLLQIFAAIRGG